MKSFSEEFFVIYCESINKFYAGYHQFVDNLNHAKRFLNHTQIEDVLAVADFKLLHNMTVIPIQMQATQSGPPISFETKLTNKANFYAWAMTQIEDEDHHDWEILDPIYAHYRRGLHTTFPFYTIYDYYEFNEEFMTKVGLKMNDWGYFDTGAQHAVRTALKKLGFPKESYRIKQSEMTMLTTTEDPVIQLKLKYDCDPYFTIDFTKYVP